MFCAYRRSEAVAAHGVKLPLEARDLPFDDAFDPDDGARCFDCRANKAADIVGSAGQIGSLDCDDVING